MIRLAVRNAEFFCMMLVGFSFSPLAAAQDISKTSTTVGILQVLMGLAVVLGSMAFFAWLLKRIGAGAGGHASVAKIVGGVSVGSRERVVVIEVADRWIVVGVAPGQVNALANLEIGALPVSASLAQAPSAQPLTTSFAQWLKKAMHQADSH